MIRMPRDDPTCPVTDSRWHLALVAVAVAAAAPALGVVDARKAVRKVVRKVASRGADPRVGVPQDQDRAAHDPMGQTPPAMLAAADAGGTAPAQRATDRSIHRIATTARRTGREVRVQKFRVPERAPAGPGRMARGRAGRGRADRVAAAGHQAGSTPADRGPVDHDRPWAAARDVAPIPFPAAADHPSRAATAARALGAVRLSKPC